MRKNVLSEIILLFSAAFFVIFPQDIKISRVAGGILHSEVINSKDTLVINILEINLDSCGCSLNTVKANKKIVGLQQTSIMASGDTVPAAINADFFEADGSIINNMISDGFIIKALSEAPYDKGGTTYSQIAFDECRKPYIERFSFDGTLIAGNNEYRIYGINTPVKKDALVLFNYYYDTRSLPKDKIHLLKFIPGSDSYSVSNYNYNTLSPDDFLLFNGKEIPLPDRVTLSLKFNPPAGNLFMLSGGWPALIKNGIKILPESEVLERVFPRFSNTRHPRTGIGFSQDSTKIYFFVVDGRQASSRGMSLNEFADLMLSYNVYNALNLDGGGSSTMVINGEVVNHPSDDTGERKVGSAIYILKK